MTPSAPVPAPVRVLSITPVWPSVAAPEQGAFVRERLRRIGPPFRLRVVRARPWFPLPVAPRSRGPRCLVELPDGEPPVVDLRFLSVPRVLKGLDGCLLHRALEAALPRLAAGGGPDLVDGHFAYPTGFAGVRLARRLGVPSLVTLRGTIVPYARDPARRRRIVEALQGATRIIAVASFLADVAVSLGADRQRIRVIPNGVDADRFRPGDRGEARGRTRLPSDRRILLTVGGLVERKGAHRVVEVLPELARAFPDLLYVVVGGGGAEGNFEGALRRRIRELDVEDRVRLAGSVAPAELPDWYRAADAFVLATSNEGWANALQEALAAGLPVVTTDVGGNREVVPPGSGGYVVPFGDSRALRDALAEALSGAADRRAIAAFGGRRSWDAVAREVEAVMREALDVGQR